VDSHKAADFEDWRKTFTAADLDELIVEAEAHLDRLRAARAIVGPAEPSENGREPTSKPEQILWVLENSGLPSMSGSAIYGALALQGWITEADKEDDRHFHKTLQKLYERHILIKPKRGHYAINYEHEVFAT
jgi:hypothetical protein